jgi:hypothetical protein
LAPLRVVADPDKDAGQARRTILMTQHLSIRTLALLLTSMAFSACATPVKLCAVKPDTAPWIGANLGVLYHYLGTPDSVEVSDGRIGFSYGALVPRGDRSDLQPATFWVVDSQVVEVTGEVFDGEPGKSVLVLWGRSNRRLSVPQFFDVLEWDRRLGLSPSESE